VTRNVNKAAGVFERDMTGQCSCQMELWDGSHIVELDFDHSIKDFPEVLAAKQAVEGVTTVRIVNIHVSL